MAKVTPAEYAAKWARNTAAAVGDYKAGIAKVTEAPGIRAAASIEKMRLNVNKALDDGTWEKRVAAVPLEKWKSSASEKGAARISQGVEGAKADMAVFGAELLSHIDSVQVVVSAMPNLTLQDNIQRAIRNMELMAEFKRS